MQQVEPRRRRIVIHSKFQSARCRLRSDSFGEGCLHPGDMRALAACIHNVNSELEGAVRSPLTSVRDEVKGNE
jgi:hypothetical protein